MKYIFLFILIFLSTLNLFASGGMEKLNETDRTEIKSILKRADKVEIYSFWSAGADGDYLDEKPVAISFDNNHISDIIDSITFKSVGVAECGFDYTIIFKKNDKNIYESPIRFNIKCNNISFYWKNDYYVCGIKDKEQLVKLLLKLINKQ